MCIPDKYIEPHNCCGDTMRKIMDTDKLVHIKPIVNEHADENV